MKGLVKCYKLQQTRSSTRITLNDRHNTCHAKLSKCCGCCLPPWGKQCIGGCLWLVSVSITHSSNGRAKKLYQDFHTARTDGWMDGWTDGRMKERRRKRSVWAAEANACLDIGSADCTLLLKSDNRFYSIFPRCRKRFKNFSPPAKQKSKKKY